MINYAWYNDCIKGDIYYYLADRSLYDLINGALYIVRDERYYYAQSPTG